MTELIDTGKLTDQVSRLVDAARAAGADASDAAAVIGRSSSVSVRLGKVESTDASDSNDVSLRVFVEGRTATVSGTADSDPAALAERAVAMAKASPEDPFEGLADAARLGRDFADLDLFDATEIAPERLREDALATEDAALGVEGVTNSSGAAASTGMGGLVLATSHGFLGHYCVTRFSRSVSVVAGQGTAMERDYDFSSRQHFAELERPEAIGRRAGERTVRRLNARKARTGPVTVIYDPRVARGMAGHLAAAINGASVARKTSFLKDMMGKSVAADAVTVTDDPLRKRGAGSRPFDGEGVVGEPMTVVENGTLRHWLLASSAARELGLETNGRAARRGGSPSPSATNFAIEPGERSPDDMIASLKSGFYVTEVFGQGVNMVSGEYSRGAAGFWIDNGELAFPVSEVTLAANLKGMFRNMEPASDIDRNFSTAAPTLMIEGMTLAGD